jgi:hypothetical protein
MKVWEVGVNSADGYETIESGTLFLHEGKARELEAKFKTEYFQEYYRVYCVQVEVNEEKGEQA